MATPFASEKRGCQHVILSEAKDLRAANRDRPSSVKRLTEHGGAREASLATGARIGLPEMLRAHRVQEWAVSLSIDGLGWRRAQHDMLAASLSMGLPNALVNSISTQDDTPERKYSLKEGSFLSSFQNILVAEEQSSTKKEKGNND